MVNGRPSPSMSEKHVTHGPSSHGASLWLAASPSVHTYVLMGILGVLWNWLIVKKMPQTWFTVGSTWNATRGHLPWRGFSTTQINKASCHVDPLLPPPLHLPSTSMYKVAT